MEKISEQRRGADADTTALAKLPTSRSFPEPGELQQPLKQSPGANATGDELPRIGALVSRAESEGAFSVSVEATDQLKIVVRPSDAVPSKKDKAIRLSGDALLWMNNRKL